MAGQNAGMIVSQPRVGEMVADLLRKQIVDGVLGDGDSLPAQEELVRRFGVSRQSLREALRILEAEGLVSVRRGSVGGATVHLPRAESAAYMLGLVLESEHVPAADLGAALVAVEPLCAGLAAQRPDRGKTIVPVLQQLNESLLAHIDDDQFTDLAGRFHEELIRHCGNHTLRIVGGTLVSLWSAHAIGWAARHQVEGDYNIGAGERREVAKSHAKLTRLILDGAADEARHFAQSHLEATQPYVLATDSALIIVTGRSLAARGNMGRGEASA